MTLPVSGVTCPFSVRVDLVTRTLPADLEILPYRRRMSQILDISISLVIVSVLHRLEMAEELRGYAGCGLLPCPSTSTVARES